MRQTKAKGVAFGTGALILVAVVVFAVLQQADPAIATGGVASQDAATDVNGTAPAMPEEAHPEGLQVPDSVLVAGREVYEEQDCSICHSIAGEGSPRSPLDGVGSRLEAEEIRLWIVDPQTASPGVRKPAFDDLPEDEVDALVAYLQSLTDE